jgi:hypothetical protein
MAYLANTGCIQHFSEAVSYLFPFSILGGSTTGQLFSINAGRCHGELARMLKNHRQQGSLTHLEAAFMAAAKRWSKELLWRQLSCSGNVLQASLRLTLSLSAT